MKRYSYLSGAALACLSAFFLPMISFADLGVTNIRMTATLVANSCTVSSDSKAINVDMGRWASKQFAMSRQGAPVPFSINLEDCGAGTSGVTLVFNGITDAVDNTLLAINGTDAAKNIGIAILDGKKNRLPVGKASEVYSIAANEKRIPLQFFGQYVATSLPVTPGTANADATFTLEYQ